MIGTGPNNWNTEISPQRWPDPPARQTPIGIRYNAMDSGDECFVPWSKVAVISRVKLESKPLHYFVMLYTCPKLGDGVQLVESEDPSEVDEAFERVMGQIADGVAIIVVP